MLCSRPEPNFTCMVSILTVCWMLSCTSCVENTEVLSALGFTHVPRNLSENLVILDLSNNNITAIEIDDFLTLKQVKKIDVSYNQIQTLHEGSFKHVHFLQELDLSYNNIVHLPRYIFSRNQNLKKLYLKKNSLQVYGDLSNPQRILDSQSLIYLDVSFCNITYISCESLQGLPNLKTLKTDGNPLTQQNIEIENPPKNPSTMKTDFGNSSILDKFCYNLQDHGVETTSSTLRPQTKDNERKDGVDIVVLSVGIALCVFVFIIVVTSYFLYTICKNRSANRIAIKKNNKIRVIQNRPLPPLPFQDDGYEEPITPNSECNSSAISSNQQFNRNFGYVPLSSEEYDSQIKTYTTTHHVSVEKNHGLAYSLSGSAEYQDSTLYPPNIFIYSSSDITEEEEEENNYPVPPMKVNYPISTSPHLSGANQPSTTGIPPPPRQMLGCPQDDKYLERKKAPRRPTPTSPASPTRNVTKFSVKKFDSEKVYVSSTSIQLGQGS